jgi:hypothetical protein
MRPPKGLGLTVAAALLGLSLAITTPLAQSTQPARPAQPRSPAAGSPAAPTAVPPDAQAPLTINGQPQDPEFAKAVKEWTTGPEFMSPLVDHLPVAPGVPTPKDVLGYYVGTPKKLTHNADLLKYYRALAAKSPRVKVIPIGTSDEQRELAIVAIGSEEAIQQLDQNRQYLGQLADPRQLTPAQAREIIQKAKPIYHLMGGLHSAETGPSEMLMELAYRLAVEDSPVINQIRDKIIVTITPAADPDGRDRYVDWYNRHLIDITNDRDRMPGPPYWGKYVFHDNNRDINYSQTSMRALLAWYLQWHPPIMHDLHESVPFLYTFSGQAPQNPTLDPILYGEMPMFANFEMAQLTKYGMPGVWTHGFVDMWSPGYLAFMSSNHNGLIRMYETFGNGGATTMKRHVAGEGGGEAGGNQTTREWYRPLPPYKEVDWSMRNNTNYMETAVLSGLQYASAFPQVVLENFYLKSRNSIDAGRKDAPYAFIIPAGQRDMTRVAMLVSLLRRQGVEVGRTAAAVKLTDGSYPAGSFLIKRDQPYGRLAKILLEKQNFPDASLRTYDDTGWTMGLMFQAEVKATADKAALETKVEAVTDVDVVLPGAVAGAAGATAYIVPDFGSNNMVTLRYRLKSIAVQAAEASFKVGTVEYPAGSFIIPAGTGAGSGSGGGAGSGGDVAAQIKSAIAPLGLTATGVLKVPDVARHDVDLPRLAMFSTWGSTQEVGWVRHAFDTFEVPYDLIYKERIKEGNLRAAYDVILIPNQGRSAKNIAFDIESRPKPVPYTKDPQFPSLGAYGSSEDITGGMGLEGVVELQKFVQAGGVLITLGTASAFATDFGIVRTVNSGRPSPQFYAPGPIVDTEILKPAHPIFYGYDKKTVPVRYANGPLLQVPETDRDQQVLMRFTGGDDAVLSGLLKGAAELRNRPAVVDVPVGTGRVLLFATNPCYRWQNHGEFGMLFNAVMHWNDVKRPPTPPAATPTASAQP